MSKKTLVTTALPYANNDLHLGHVLEYIQADIWVRFKRLTEKDNDIAFLAGSDTHGTPIMLRAELLEITPEELIESCHNENLKIFEGFNISFDYYGSTNQPSHYEMVNDCYQVLKAKDSFSESEVSQFYDEYAQIFLPDRYVKGTCPKCSAPDQYGDNCEVCASTYTSEEVVTPYSTVTYTAPVIKESKNIFFDLPKYEADIKQWFTTANPLQETSKNKINEWFNNGLKKWDVSREAPYFGIKIPDTENKYFYVWLDAPIGYITFYKAYCEARGLSFDEICRKDNKDFEMYHFIGKDILYFHSLFWPGLLSGIDRPMPTKINVHGFVMVNGEKMSKSRGTFIKAKTWLKYFSADALRYYYAAKLGNDVIDVDLNLSDFIQRVNADLVNKYANTASRSASFIKKFFNNTYANELDDAEAYQALVARLDSIKENFANLSYAKAIRELGELADQINSYFDAKTPWVLAKYETKREELHRIITQTIFSFRLIVLALKPVLPDFVAKAEEFLNESVDWDNVYELPFGKTINDFKPLFTRLEEKTTEELIAFSAQEAKEEKETNEKLEVRRLEKLLAKIDPEKFVKIPPQFADRFSAKDANAKPASQPTFVPPALKEEIVIDDFAKLDLRVGTVLVCENVEGSDKLLRFVVDLGEAEPRQIFSGIRANYSQPEQLVGTQVIVVANLAPRKMRFGVSQGMILSAKDASGLSVITSSKAVANGAEVA